ncbi:MAG: MarR family transcriptional regulator [Pseudomonadota bacterium]
MALQEDTYYRLDDQIGFILRKANQRHTGIFAGRMPQDLTPTRFAALAKLLEHGELSQNELGRHTAMDSATIKGVVDRLRERGLVQTRKAVGDGRLQLVSLTDKGEEIAEASLSRAHAVTDETYGGLDASERRQLIALLRRIT